MLNFRLARRIGDVQTVGDLEGFLVRAVEVRQQGVGQVDAVGFVQVVEYSLPFTS